MGIAGVAMATTWRAVTFVVLIAVSWNLGCGTDSSIAAVGEEMRVANPESAVESSEHNIPYDEMEDILAADSNEFSASRSLLGSARRRRRRAWVRKVVWARRRRTPVKKCPRCLHGARLAAKTASERRTKSGANSREISSKRSRSNAAARVTATNRRELAGKQREIGAKKIAHIKKKKTEGVQLAKNKVANAKAKRKRRKDHELEVVEVRDKGKEKLTDEITSKADKKLQIQKDKIRAEHIREKLRLAKEKKSIKRKDKKIKKLDKRMAKKDKAALVEAKRVAKKMAGVEAKQQKAQEKRSRARTAAEAAASVALTKKHIKAKQHELVNHLSKEQKQKKIDTAVSERTADKNQAIGTLKNRLAGCESCRKGKSKAEITEAKQKGAARRRCSKKGRLGEAEDAEEEADCAEDKKAEMKASKGNASDKNADMKAPARSDKGKDSDRKADMKADKGKDSDRKADKESRRSEKGGDNDER